MATPLIKISINTIEINVTSLHREIHLVLCYCPKTADVNVKVVTQTVAGFDDASTQAFASLLEDLKVFPEDYLRILSKSFTGFFGEGVELYLHFTHSRRETEVIHLKEALAECKSEAYGLLQGEIYKIERTIIREERPDTILLRTYFPK